MALGEMAELLAEQPHQIVDDTLARMIDACLALSGALELVQPALAQQPGLLAQPWAGGQGINRLASKSVVRSVASPSRRGDVNDDVDRSEERCAR